MATPSRPWYSVLYIQVLIAIAVGILIGHFFPDAGVALKPLGDGFISLIKMMIAPVIFCTVVHGIGSMSDPKKGRAGARPDGGFFLCRCRKFRRGRPVCGQAGSTPARLRS